MKPYIVIVHKGTAGEGERDAGAQLDPLGHRCCCRQRGEGCAKNLRCPDAFNTCGFPALYQGHKLAGRKHGQFGPDRGFRGQDQKPFAVSK